MIDVFGMWKNELRLSESGDKKKIKKNRKIKKWKISENLRKELDDVK